MIQHRQDELGEQIVTARRNTARAQRDEQNRTVAPISIPCPTCNSRMHRQERNIWACRGVKCPEYGKRMISDEVTIRPYVFELDE